MSEFPADLRFCYAWRPYQARILKESKAYLEDGRLHIIAAPGAGKTALGLELMRRLNRPTLIFAPTLAVRDQWIDRFKELFAQKCSSVDECISIDYREPRLLTVITYQALHSGFSSTAILPVFWQKPVTLILDEAHHLRNEWWATLSALIARLPSADLISLTATPPYDVPPDEWRRYNHLCGPIDAKISVPELVLDGTLCPHQDYLWFSRPTEKESEQIRLLRGEVTAFREGIAEDRDFQEALEKHPWLMDPETHVDDILASSRYASALLVFAHDALLPYSVRLLRTLGLDAGHVPKLDEVWLQELFTGCLYADPYMSRSHGALLRRLRTQLRRIGVLEGREISLFQPARISRWLSRSASKLESIGRIVQVEQKNLGPWLRMAILTDYVRSEDLPQAPWDEKPLQTLGVVPIFEKLRRELQGYELGILTGTLLVVPAGAVALLEKICQELNLPKGLFVTRPLAHDEAYHSVEMAPGEMHRSVSLLTRLFECGGIHILIGTKSLLGEGWDAPCINSLIIASTAATVVQSNQMRGRAIRSQAGNAQKTASIWHLICVDAEGGSHGSDWGNLERRFKTFAGVAFDRDVIENGIERMGVSGSFSSAGETEGINARMAAAVVDRGGLFARWQRALNLTQEANPRMVDALQIPAACSLPLSVGGSKGNYQWGWSVAPAVLGLGAWCFKWAGGPSTLGLELLGGGTVGSIIFLKPFVEQAILRIRNRTPADRWRQIGWALIKSLHAEKMISLSSGHVRVEERTDGTFRCYWDTANTHDQMLFADTFQELLTPVRKARYLLEWKAVAGDQMREWYVPVPTVLARKKEMAERFQAQWAARVGYARLIYAYGDEGRWALMKASQQFLAAGFPSLNRVEFWK